MSLFRTRRGFPAALSALALALVVLGAVLRQAAGFEAAFHWAAAALALYLVLEGRRAGMGGRLMLAVAGAATLAALALADDPQAAIEAGAGAAVFLVGLFTALGFLREAAETSTLVREAGAFLVAQPPGRRYAVLTAGAHLVAQVLNFGVLSLLGTLVMKGNTAEAAGGDAAVVELRKRRMMTALLRGFAAMTAWSPLAVAFAVVTHTVAGAGGLKLILVQMLMAALLMALGWAEDRIRFPRRPPAGLPPSPAADWGPLWRLALLVAAVVGASVAAAQAMEVRMVVGAMIAVPPAALVWLTFQQQGASLWRRVSGAASRFATGAGESLPGLRNEVAMLGGAVYVGSILAALAAQAGAGRWVEALELPPVALAIVLSAAVVLLARLGLNQLITVTLLGGSLPDLARLGLDPLVLASGLMGAWALAANVTPMGAATLAIARQAKVDVSEVVGPWNGRYVAAGIVFLAAWIAVVDKLVR